MLQGAALKGGGAILLYVCGSPEPFVSCSKLSLFYLKTCTRPEGNPVKHRLKKAVTEKPRTEGDDTVRGSVDPRFKAGLSVS